LVQSVPYEEGQLLLPLVQCRGNILCKMLPRWSSGNVAIIKSYRLWAAAVLQLSLNYSNLQHIVKKLPTRNSYNFRWNQLHGSWSFHRTLIKCVWGGGRRRNERHAGEDEFTESAAPI